MCVWCIVMDGVTGRLAGLAIADAPKQEGAQKKCVWFDGILQLMTRNDLTALGIGRCPYCGRVCTLGSM